jgi:catechol 2,3-dioxygenase-like lactoylglutathione lyase family enzyme
MSEQDPRPPLWVGHVVLETDRLEETEQFMRKLGMRPIASRCRQRHLLYGAISTIRVIIPQQFNQWHGRPARESRAGCAWHIQEDP